MRRAIIVNVWTFIHCHRVGQERYVAWIRLCGIVSVRRRSDASVSPDDAEEAVKKLNQKEFFGKVVKVEIAKPKKKGCCVNRRSSVEKAMEQEDVSKEEAPVTSGMSEEKKQEKMLRLRTIVIFGVQRGMKLETLSRK